MKRLLACLALFASPLALADAIDVSLNGRALIGQGQPPAVLVHINEPIAGFELKLKRSDGKDISVKGGGRPGQTRTLDLQQPEGKFSYTGELVVNFNNGTTSSMPMQFEAELFGPLRMKCEKKDVDLANRKITFTLTRPAGKAHLMVLMDTGKRVIDDDINFNGEAPGTPLEVSWPEATGLPMKIVLTAYDTSTFFTGIEFYPWQVDIPHEEVNFDSGKWDIRKEEAAKLDKSFTLVDDAVTKYGRLADIKLYVVGHTDTVGATDYNRNLSLNRARAIGGYFKKRGIRIPVHYAGMGEEALAVQTADETDEQRNRRAEYIISIENPTVQHAAFVPKWQRL